MTVLLEEENINEYISALAVTLFTDQEMSS